METNEKRKKQMSVPADNNDHTRRNRFTGEVIELTKEECEKHDAIFFHDANARYCLASMRDVTFFH